MTTSRNASGAEIYHGLKVGSNLPGAVTAGRLLQHGEWAFWDVHDSNRAITIRLHDEHYAKLVIGVDDPSGTVSAITAALAHRRGGGEAPRLQQAVPGARVAS